LAVFIGCLGLYGLAEITATRRTKEIGIRKVVGASANRIVALVSREFVWLAVAGNLAAAPISALVMHRWLQNFAYHVDLAVWMFAGAGITTLSLALCSVSYQTLKAALTKPVDTLRNE
jgi:putative ABC transport system permease protein